MIESSGEDILLLRRKFLIQSLKATGLCACLLSTSLLSSCEWYWEKTIVPIGITKEINVTDETGLQKIGFGIMKAYKDVNLGVPVFIVKTTDTTFTCFSSLCTHESCFGDKLYVKPGRGTIVCGCHNSEFNAMTDGKPFPGSPAEKPLKQYQTSYDIQTKILLIMF